MSTAATVVGPVTFRPSRPVDLFLTLAPLAWGGAKDLSLRLESDGVWRATRTPSGPATTHLWPESDRVVVEAWGPGADWAVAHAPILLGGQDDEKGFVPHHPLIGELHRLHPGLRIPRSEAVFEAVLPIILEQKVPGVQARRAYVQMVRALGEPAPGPGGLTLPPSPSTVATTPYWALHRFGVERRRAESLRQAAVHAPHLEAALAMNAAEAQRRLVALPGLGPWSAAKVALVALGDADAVPVGDYHLPHLVSWALEGKARGTDERMLELLEPYRGHRGRVVRLLQVSGLTAPRFGPRLPLRRIAQY